jgi:malate dehydrogenase (oxaloacetate-decarboxylating)(NADP+)
VHALTSWSPTKCSSPPRTHAEQASEDNLAAELIYPERDGKFGASLLVAERVAACIFDQGLARVPRPADVGALIRSRIYRPVYPQ